MYLKIGSFPEGTVIVKELTRVLDPTSPDGSRAELSGRGYFNGEFNGLDVTAKDSKRFAKTNGWGFFNFGHHPLPYAESAEEAPASECASCHAAFVAKTDMTWFSSTQCFAADKHGRRASSSSKKEMEQTQQLHNLGQNPWLGWHNPVLKPKAATGTAVQAAAQSPTTGKRRSQLGARYGYA